jgi:hypothetical protein
MVLLLCPPIIPASSLKWEAPFDILIELREILKAIRERGAT